MYTIIHVDCNKSDSVGATPVLPTTDGVRLSSEGKVPYDLVISTMGTIIY